jgi:hypothetical protein
MSPPFLHPALAREPHKMLLAEAEAGRRARQAKLARRRRGTMASSSSLLRWPPDWLPSASSHPSTRRPGPARAATGAPAALPDRSAMAGAKAWRDAHPGTAACPEPSLR